MQCIDSGTQLRQRLPVFLLRIGACNRKAFDVGDDRSQYTR